MFVAASDPRTNLHDMPTIVLHKRDLELVMIEPCLKIKILVNFDSALRLGGRFAVFVDPIHKPIWDRDDRRVIVELVFVAVRMDRAGRYDVTIIGAKGKPLATVPVRLPIAKCDRLRRLPEIIMTESLAGPDRAGVRHWLAAFLCGGTHAALDVEFKHA